MEFTTVKELYHNTDAYIGKEITVGGWVRSNRDSKAFGFIVLHDGTLFETLQVVYSDQLENFAEICKINVGAAVIVKGTLVATPDAKQPFEIQAAGVELEGAFHSGLSDAEEAPFSGISAYRSASASAYQYVPGCIPCALPDRLCHSSVLPGERLCLCAYADHHRKRLRGCR